MNASVQVGDKIETWFSGEADGKSTVLEVRPYDGRYKMWFSHTLVLTAPRTIFGRMTMAYNAKPGTVAARAT